MNIFKREQQHSTLPEMPQWSDADLAEFDREMEKYRYEYTLRNGEVIRPIDEKKFHVDQGSMNAEGAVIIRDMEIRPRYEILEDKLRQWKAWKGRKEFGQKQRDIQLGNLAEKMRIDPGPSDE